MTRPIDFSNAVPVPLRTDYLDDPSPPLASAGERRPGTSNGAGDGVDLPAETEPPYLFAKEEPGDKETLPTDETGKPPPKGKSRRRPPAAPNPPPAQPQQPPGSPRPAGNAPGAQPPPAPPPQTSPFPNGVVPPPPMPPVQPPPQPPLIGINGAIPMPGTAPAPWTPPPPPLGIFPWVQPATNLPGPTVWTGQAQLPFGEGAPPPMPIQPTQPPGPQRRPDPEIK
jgi:hypothetical protein